MMGHNVKDFSVKITVRNNHLLSAVADKFGTSAEFSRQSGVKNSAIAAYMTMKVAPVNKSGWRSDAVNIASALGLYPSDIWPEHMQQVRMAMATAEVQMDAKEVKSIIAHRDGIDQTSAADLLRKITDTLSPRYKAFMQWRLLFGSEATFDECGEVLGVTRERARQIECKAMRMMRNRAKRLGVKRISDLIE
tara:strand:- start:391 stop:966 length:576 start_codon:yes stop_codon:yes gene_type:complete